MTAGSAPDDFNDEPILTARFDEALAYASEAHRRQLRKGTRTPYIAHLLGVASLAIEDGADEDQAIAALLHDAVEDQGGDARLKDIRARFGDRVADIVLDCTDSWVVPKPEWKQRKSAYIASLAEKSTDSLLVSLADKTHNARAIVSDVSSHGNEVWERFTAPRSEVLWYYDSLAKAFLSRLPGIAASRLDRLVAELRKV